mgnify:CR=1 FL=1
MPVPSALSPFATEPVTVDATVGGVRLTITNVLATPKPRACVITVETAPLRWLADGTAPTSTAGHVANPTDVLEIQNAGEMGNFRAIRTGATSATIRVSYYR